MELKGGFGASTGATLCGGADCESAFAKAAFEVDSFGGRLRGIFLRILLKGLSRKVKLD